MSDLRSAVRTLRRAPGFTLLAQLTLALGIGGTTAVFSVVHGILLKALPYPDPDRIVTIAEADGASRTRRVSNPNFQDWSRAAQSFAAMAAWTGGPSAIRGGSEPIVTGVYSVTRGFFDALGVAPIIGRTFTADESRENGTPAAVVSHALWRRVLGGEADLARLTLVVEGRSAAVVGVMPPGFAFPDEAEVWIPKEIERDETGRTSHNLQVVARLRPDTSIAQAQAEMSAIAAQLETRYGDDHDNPDASVERLQDRIVGPSRRLLLVLFAAVSVVLLGACLNVAGLLLARGADRRRELAVRVAMGAPRGRLVRLLFVEHLLLAGAGGVLGIAAAAVLVRALVALAPGQLPRLGDVSLDPTAVAFAVALSVLTPLVFGLAPALSLSRPNLRDAFAESGRGAAAGGRSRARHLLVAIQVALALVLLCGTGLMVRSVMRLLAVNPGFQPAGAIALRTTVPGDRYTDGPAAARFYAAMLDRVAMVPGVASAGITNAPPLGGSDANGAFLFDGQSFDEIRGNWQAQSASYRVVGGRYFDALGIPISRGRAFDDRDRAGAEPVAVINDTMARRYFATRDPLGQRIRFAGMDRDNPALTIVGISGDVRHRLASDPVPEVYVHYAQLPMRMQYFVTTVVRLAPGLSVGATVPALADAVRQIDGDVPTEFSTMTSLVDRAVADRRFAMLVLTAFGVLALVLAAVGVYGVLAQAVVARTPEIGVRMALGASPTSVVGLVLAGAGVAMGAGLVAGLSGAAVVTRFLGSLLYEVEPSDPVTYAGVIGVLGLVALVAGVGPVLRAMRIDPVAAIRGE
jgi:predicted permease